MGGRMLQSRRGAMLGTALGMRDSANSLLGERNGRSSKARVFRASRRKAPKWTIDE